MVKKRRATAGALRNQKVTPLTLARHVHAAQCFHGWTQQSGYRLAFTMDEMEQQLASYIEQLWEEFDSKGLAGDTQRSGSLALDSSRVARCSAFAISVTENQNSRQSGASARAHGGRTRELLSFYKETCSWLQAFGLLFTARVVQEKCSVRGWNTWLLVKIAQAFWHHALGDKGA